MNIHPTDSGSASRPGAGRLKKSSASPEPRAGSTPRKRAARAARDNVEISDAAKQLLEATRSSGTTRSALSPDRMKQVLQRITNGFYNRPEIREAMLRELLIDIGFDPFGLD